jgi:hypothetical protein
VTVRKYRWDGVLEWSHPGAPEARAAVAFDPDGNLVLGQQWAVTRFDPRGEPRWRRELDPVDGFITAVGATRVGTVFAAGTHGDTISAGGLTAPVPEGATRGAFLAAFAARDGAPAWLRSTGPAELLRPGGAGGPGADVDLAADPDGWVALLVGRSGCDLRIDRWAVDGTRLWTRGVDAPACEDAAVFPSAIDVAPGHDVVVGGGFRTPVDLGRGRVESRGGLDGFVIDLAP